MRLLKQKHWEPDFSILQNQFSNFVSIFMFLSNFLVKNNNCIKNGKENLTWYLIFGSRQFPNVHAALLCGDSVNHNTTVAPLAHSPFFF